MKVHIHLSYLRIIFLHKSEGFHAKIIFAFALSYVASAEGKGAFIFFRGANFQSIAQSDRIEYRTNIMKTVLTLADYAQTYVYLAIWKENHCFVFCVFRFAKIILEIVKNKRLLQKLSF